MMAENQEQQNRRPDSLIEKTRRRQIGKRRERCEYARRVVQTRVPPREISDDEFQNTIAAAQNAPAVLCKAIGNHLDPGKLAVRGHRERLTAGFRVERRRFSRPHSSP